MKKLVLITGMIALFGCHNTDSDTQATAPAADTGKTNGAPAASGIPAAVSPETIEKENAGMIEAGGDNIAKAQVSAADSTVSITANMRADHRIFGYAEPDIHSKRMILLSIFTNDVENNPFQCPFGAYYGTDGMENTMLKYTGDEGSFAKVQLLKDGKEEAVVYMEKKWLEFE